MRLDKATTPLSSAWKAAKFVLCGGLLCCGLQLVAASDNVQKYETFPVTIELAQEENNEMTRSKNEVLQDQDWHKNIWQNSPAIIEISEKHLNLLFNRPEIVFGLRRAIRFDWQGSHEYNDGKALTTYHFSLTGSGTALIEYQSISVEDHMPVASGSFTINSRP